MYNDMSLTVWQICPPRPFRHLPSSCPCRTRSCPFINVWGAFRGVHQHVQAFVHVPQDHWTTTQTSSTPPKWYSRYPCLSLSLPGFSGNFSLTHSLTHSLSSPFLSLPPSPSLPLSLTLARCLCLPSSLCTSVILSSVEAADATARHELILFTTKMHFFPTIHFLPTFSQWRWQNSEKWS